VSIHLTIEGRTVDASTGEVLAGITVRAFPGQSSRAIGSTGLELQD
jgi:hypothetical protein